MDFDEEEDLDEEDQNKTQDEDADKETYFMGTNSPARKRFNTNRSRPMFRSRPSFSRRQSPYYTPNRDLIKEFRKYSLQHKIHNKNKIRLCDAEDADVLNAHN